ncbi:MULTISPECIES: NAD(P)/FAD-dependent oxidoreductase [unclassified Paracoccus (in: a-proteobacteria)]|uniref:NAD(P)/FAD-dependent oxidoreductase n=1 Tax=unclassified Paracoccus (in: a-proteobacteria) TaxID=2688777 RepID=UPI001F29DB15|nr:MULTISPECIES: NAD(P)/FAD-dependent oxidoreductase [unclassified Paracoccus (in: a-proteobacteria)]
MTDRMPLPDEPLDCLIVGGGPAGLTAAIYLGRFHRRVAVVDKGEGRLQMVPRSHNHPGYPEGVTGVNLLEDMREQATRYGATLLPGEVTAITREGELFLAETDEGRVSARTVMLGTGVVNHRPPLDEATHADAVARGLLRYCPICDAYEQTGKRIGVLGGNRHGLAEAMFLRSYSRDITLIPMTGMRLDEDERDQAGEARVDIVERPMSALNFDNDCVQVTLEDGQRLVFDTLYVALGTHTRNELGVMLGIELAEGQCFVTDERQRTTIPGIYAAGDAVQGLDQIGFAIGTGTRAAVAIHNDLRDQDGQMLD